MKSLPPYQREAEEAQKKSTVRIIRELMDIGIITYAEIQQVSMYLNMAFHLGYDQGVKLRGVMHQKPVKQITGHGKRLVIATYSSAREAAKRTGTDKMGISRCCNGHQHTAGGFRWAFD